jgi:hypothetical protein
LPGCSELHQSQNFSEILIKNDDVSTSSFDILDSDAPYDSSMIDDVSTSDFDILDSDAPYDLSMIDDFSTLSNFRGHSPDCRVLLPQIQPTLHLVPTWYLQLFFWCLRLHWYLRLFLCISSV